MRILFLSPRQCWPPRSGAKLREYHFARALGGKSDLTYVHFIEPGVAAPSQADLPFCQEIVSIPKPPAYSPLKIARGVLGRWPLPVLNYTSPEMTRALSRLTQGESYDLLHLDSIHMAGYVDAISRSLNRLGKSPAQVVYNWHNIESEAMRRYSVTVNSPLRRIYAKRTATQLEELERSILRTACGHLVCSDRERAKLHAIAPEARVATIFNGVDTAYFAPPSTPGAPPNRIVFVGLLNYHPNIEAAVAFARGVWPRLREAMPEYRLTLVGAQPAPSVLALRDIPGVEVTGTVPDLRPYYREAVAAIVPLRTGGGTRLKILEALAAGVPVVSTPLGAEGLEIEPRKNILLVEPDDADAWIRELTALAQSESLRRELIANGLRLVRQRYDWTALGDTLHETYQSWLEQTR